ncbi:MAG: 3-deoxy-D-manno-octulosonic acid transferase [Planctomycetia bacterium]|nr:3-deoxy-D-manno-octulosonic acid transferase [Planctomycetia bacterium]
MPGLLNLLYLLALLIASPWLLYRRWRQGKRLGGLRTKLTGDVVLTMTSGASPGQNQRIWLHAVSVGEVLLLQPIINKLKQQFPDFGLYLSVTTTTGREVAEKTYPDLNIIWFPFDFTWAVNRALLQIQPQLIILAELELWPNFITIAHARCIPVIVVNGRMGQRSFRGYQRLRWLISPLLKRIDHFAVQQEEYAQRLLQLGMPAEKISITGSVKFDGVTVNRHDAKVEQMRTLLGIKKESLVWVVGSTQAPEESWALEIFQIARPFHPDLTLIIVPRHQERFQEVADLMAKSGLPFRRRSTLNTQHSAPGTTLFLIDTLGELKTIWGLADVAFVGGSFNERGGQNMIEPAAYGAAVTFGPNTWNFKQIVQSLLEHRAAIEVKNKNEWAGTTTRLLASAAERQELGNRAQQFVASQQGATQKTIELIEPYLQQDHTRKQAA